MKITLSQLQLFKERLNKETGLDYVIIQSNGYYQLGIKNGYGICSIAFAAAKSDLYEIMRGIENTMLEIERRKTNNEEN